MSGLFYIGAMALLGFCAILLIAGLFTRLYHKANKEQAFVRTGAGGERVIKDGGALVIPGLHEKTDINMKTLRIEVTRRQKEALITKDQLRVDVSASFFVRVKPDELSIATAARTLGQSTQDPDELRGLIEDKFVDALRSVAAGMKMGELHEQRAQFVQSVQETVAEDLIKNGLELESVSLTGLDQTDPSYLNPENAFDAEGLTLLTRITQTKARERNEIEQATRIAIEKRNLESEQESLKIKREGEFARLEQEREIETKRAAQESELAKQRAERKRESDIAAIEAERATKEAQVAASQKTRAAEIASTQAIEIAEQDRHIAVAQKSEEESKARAKADSARAEAIRAAEQVKTVEVVEAAERQKRVEIIAAEKDAGKEATRIKVLAEAEFDAAEKRALAKFKELETVEREYKVRADGELKLNEAANKLSPEQLALKQREIIINGLPAILQEMAKPMANIDSIRIVSMPGLNGVGGENGGTGGAGSENLANSVADAALRFRLQAPIVDQLASTVGIDLSKGLNGVVESLVTDAPITNAINAPIAQTGNRNASAQAIEVADVEKKDLTKAIEKAAFNGPKGQRTRRAAGE